MKWFLTLILCIILSACKHGRYDMMNDRGPSHAVDVSHVKNAVPKIEPKSRFGNPPSYIVRGKKYYVMNNSAGYKEKGIASWYGMKFHSKRTSNGERYDMFAMTAAHKTLPLPTYLRVTNLKNGHHVIVKVNDRGPFHENRIIDLSYAAAKKLNIMGDGTGYVHLEAINPNASYQAPVSEITPVDKPIQNNPTIFLQAGAFSIRENADYLARQLEALTRNPINIKHEINKQHPIYKVQIGPLISLAAANNLSNIIKEAGLGTPVTVLK